MNWTRIFNRLFEIIDEDGPTYFSGGRFLTTVREVDPYFSDYSQYIEERRKQNKSSTRRVYFHDILLSFEEPDRFRLVNAILEQVGHLRPEQASAIRSELGGVAAVPTARVDPDSWNAERLNRFLEDMDSRIAAGKHDGAVALAYTCLEGFLKAFLMERVSEEAANGDIIQLSKAVRTHLRATIDQYPDEALNLLTHIAHAVDRARNRFSESHFDSQASRWLAMFARDLVNAEIRLLLHFK